MSSGSKYLFKGVRDVFVNSRDRRSDDNQAVLDGSKRVFVVHGHDHAALEQVTSFLEGRSLEPVVLMRRAHRGETIIQQVERLGSVAYVIALFTKDDLGAAGRDYSAASEAALRPRARQNVLFEYGYFCGALGRDRIAVVVEPGVELPSDVDGLGYIAIGADGRWIEEIERELRAAGLLPE